jgi:anthranilate phosphoribosyltransferase
MQTISKVDDLLLSLLNAAIDEIDMVTVQEALRYLRSTVSVQVKNAVEDLGRNAIDLAGTGGSGIAKFNTSTASAFVVAAHGVNVIKFGNRSITGTSGSMDFLAALGFSNDLGLEQFTSTFESANLLFLNAAHCYPLLASVREERKALGRASIFNFLGPLLNPASPAFRLLGVSNESIRNLLTTILVNDKSIKRAITVRSSNGLDEFDPHQQNNATLIDRRTISESMPVLITDSSIPASPRRQAALANSILIQSSKRNASIFHEIMNGNDTQSDDYLSLVLNSGAGFLAAGAAQSLDEGTALAKELIADGSARKKFEQIRSKSS